jgi:hypothetical protein
MGNGGRPGLEEVNPGVQSGPPSGQHLAPVAELQQSATFVRDGCRAHRNATIGYKSGPDLRGWGAGERPGPCSLGKSGTPLPRAAAEMGQHRTSGNGAYAATPKPDGTV